MSNQRLMKVKEKAGDGYAKTNAIARKGGATVPLDGTRLNTLVTRFAFLAVGLWFIFRTSRPTAS